MRWLFGFLLFFATNHVFSEDLTSNSAVFSSIYERGEWGVDEQKKGNSGTGSDPQNAKMYLAFLNNYLREHQIKSVVDLGCGDWRIGKEVCWDGIQYIGIDVVGSVIEQNSKEYASANISFVKADGSDYSLPKADLLICKDVLQHLPFKDIKNIIKQFSKFKHCIIVNDVDPITLTCSNINIPRGHYRPLDLTKPPFSLLGRKVLSYASGLETKLVLQIQYN